jgi:hypothetical protein
VNPESLQAWQIAACAACLLLMLASGVWRAWQARREPARGRLELAGLGALFLGAWLLRACLSPHTLLHENAHGYEILQGAFSLEGYFWHGAGYYTFFHGLTRLLGDEPGVVFQANALLGGLTAVLVWAVGRRLLGAGAAAWLAAVAWAASPAALREGGSESMLPLGVCAGLLGLWAWLDGFQAGGRWCSLLLAAACLAFTAQVRPELALWLALPPLGLVACPGWRAALRRPSTWAALASFALLAAPWLVFRLQDLATAGLPGYLELGPGRFLAALVSQEHLLLRADWTTMAAWVFLPLGLWAGLRQAPRALPVLLGGYLALGWIGLAAQGGQATQVRLQQPLLPLLALLVGLGGAWLSGRLPAPGRAAGAWVLGLLLLSTGLLRAPQVRALATAQLEFAFQERALPGLPAECGLVVPDRFMAGRVISTEQATWRLGDRPLAELTPFLEDAQTAAAAPCWVLYRGLTCHLFTHAETPPADGVRPECRAPEARYLLQPLVEEILPAIPYDYLRLPASRVRLGLYRLVPR